MRFPSPLQRGRLVQRYKRFFADVVLESGEAVTAHCPNPGAMLGLNNPGMPVWVSRSSSPTRKLAHTLELVEAEDGLVGVNTHRPNGLAAEALAEGAVAELAGYAGVRREVRYGASSRVDFLLEGPSRPRLEKGGAVERPRAWVEVKSVTLSRKPGVAEWPDCVSARSTKHLRELAAKIDEGDRAVILFVVQRQAETFRTADDLDPVFGRTLREVVARGVEVLAYACELSPEEVRLSRRLGWQVGPVVPTNAV